LTFDFFKILETAEKLIKKKKKKEFEFGLEKGGQNTCICNLFELLLIGVSFSRVLIKN